MKNLIYLCVFHSDDYLNLLELFIDSFFINANFDKSTTDILILTSIDFYPKIERRFKCFDLSLNYYILDLDTLFEKNYSLSVGKKNSLFNEICYSKLTIFNYEHINLYDKILYLDIDILFNNDINTIFNLQIDDAKLYTLEEGHIWYGFWGSDFFDFSKINRNLTAFTGGLLYFRNSHTIKSLFGDINKHIMNHVYIENRQAPLCADQPFLVYNTINQNKYDNQILKLYVKNSGEPTLENVYKASYILYHFPTAYGNFQVKYNCIKEMNNNIFSKYLKNTQIHKFEAKELLDKIKNKKFEWRDDRVNINGFILFNDDNKLTTNFQNNHAYYEILNNNSCNAVFCGHTHTLTFNSNISFFLSIRDTDFHTSSGTRVE